jgi:hypothetical protein
MVKYISEGFNTLIELNYPIEKDNNKKLNVIDAFKELNNEAIKKFPTLLSLLLLNINLFFEKYNRIVLYGYGTFGEMIHTKYSSKIIHIIDKSKLYSEIPKIIDISGIKNSNYDIILISLIGREKQIISELMKYDVPKEKIFFINLSEF